ncbi:MAG: TlyA family RNA methyltransferase [Candidatus Paceibacterota bacterium]|jgi:23S rRNA (cytidine1920-2'-O)/16S rRNA (cytidine1409-2'-O)-methyltransferase
MRLDTEILSRGLAKSRTSAQELIIRGSVLVNKLPAKKASQNVTNNDTIEITTPLPYVSRGGEKLAHALSYFNISPKDLICADIGSSTGGFTDCLLQNKAKMVYAIDVGTDQLDQKLKDDSRVISIEKTDIRNTTLPEKISLVVIDVSFISVIKILSAIKSLLLKNGEVVVLVKPQFEVGKDNLNRKGIVIDITKREDAIRRVVAESEKIGFILINQTTSPITGGDGNIEYLLYLKKIDKEK